MDSCQKKRIKKRRRTVITPEEIERLEECFKAEQKPDRTAKLELARELSKPENFINIWFQNRRAKERKLGKTPLESDSFQPSLESMDDNSNSALINAPPLFRHMVTMAAASEGGILPLDCPDINRAITESCRGIKLKDGVLLYNNDFGFELVELVE